MSHTVRLGSPKKGHARGVCSMSKPRDSSLGQHAGPDAIDISVKIQITESSSIYEDRLTSVVKAGLGSCLPKALNAAREAWSPRDFYDNVFAPDRANNPSLPPLSELKCNLLPFQARAVRWMLQREEGDFATAREPLGLPYGFVKCIDGDGRTCFLSRFLGAATSDAGMTEPIQNGLKGGILSEEMGLGKTVEMIALMCLNKKPDTVDVTAIEGQHPTSRATLIVTPPAILQQWKNELESLAPDMHVYIYDGLKVEAEKADHEELLRRFSRQDVVLTTFNVLSKEIHYAEKYERDLRHAKRYERRVSPLTRMLWWRVVLDEAQMIEGGVNNAAKVATLIPREHAWCVSGTPVKKDHNDIFGLLLFLKYSPYSELPKLWSRLVMEHRPLFRRIIHGLTLRHTKEQIKEDLHLPPQKRVVITVPFTQIEEQHYSTMFQEMAEDCGLDTNGGPLSDDWDPESSTVINKMRMWLTRLRQTCLHPEVGTRNRRALGGRGPLRTVNEVLEVMIEQNQTATRTEERILLQSQLRRGQILEHADKPEAAAKIWQNTLKEVESIVEECRRSLALAMQQEKELDSQVKIVGDEEEETAARSLSHRSRLRSALELEHACVFFIANSYFQLKEVQEQKDLRDASQGEASVTVEDVTDLVAAEVQQATEASDLDLRSSTSGTDPKSKETPEKAKSDAAAIGAADLPKSMEFLALEKQEVTFYERAKLLRKEILADARGKADVPIQKVRDKEQSFALIPAITAPTEKGGLESRRVIDKVEALVEVMQSQTKYMEEWRTKTAELLALPLVDESEADLQADSDEAGKEYETSTKQQDESYVYVDALRALVADRHDILTGQHNVLVEHELKVALAEAKEGKGHAPQLLQELLKIRKKLQPAKEIGSLRGLLTELRELKTDLRGAVERGNSRAAAEVLIINKAMMKLQQISTEQTKVTTALEKEVELFKDTMNLRLEYYRQLQAISDSVAPYEEELSEEARENVLGNKEAHEEYLRSRVATLKSKGRYLLHLRNESSNTESERICIICQHTFENGILTSCGHTYCLECLQLWWSAHRTCPACKKHLHKTDFHSITYKPQELTIEEESGFSGSALGRSEVADNTQALGIYSGIRENTLNQIKNVDLEGSFGTKIDTIARHILWIRQHDPGAKSIVFSQYRDFLDVLARAFKHFKIGFTGIDRKGGIESFKKDPALECFFLHAKAHSSGLNLVNATHVFLCEPLINTAIELQAIARVHRIGQQHETTVWMYLVEGTVEKSIYDISVQRRMAHMGHVNGGGDNNGRSKEQTTALEHRIEAANTLEMEDTALSDLLTKGSGGGEMVPPEDLWDCLFRQRPGRITGKSSEEAQREVARQLGADAAEARMGGECP